MIYLPVLVESLRSAAAVLAAGLAAFIASGGALSGPSQRGMLAASPA